MRSTSPGLDTERATTLAAPPEGVFVLGMARSGTSAVTRLLTLLGLYPCVESDLSQPGPNNRFGSFESRTLVSFNLAFLRRWSNYGWTDPCLPDDWQEERGVRVLHRPARRLFDSLHPRGPWVFKDPNLNFLMPFWVEALDRTPDVVFAYRHPAEVARSFERFLGVPFEQGLRIWERHNRSALKQLDGLAALVVEYDEVISRPRAVATTATDWLRRRGYVVPAGVEDAAAESIDPGERHWQAETASDAILPGDVCALLNELKARRGAHEKFSSPALPPAPTAYQPPGERLRTLLRRPRWWWWMAEMIMPPRLARTARMLPSPGRLLSRNTR